MYKKGNKLKTIYCFCKVRPLARPRENYRQPIDNQRELFRELNNYRCSKAIDEPVIINADIHFNSKKNYPTDIGYGDIDNLEKAIYDGLVKFNIIRDDRLIVEGRTSKMSDIEDFLKLDIYKVKRGDQDERD